MLNNNFDLVNDISHKTLAYCSIFQNDTRIATTLEDSEGNRIVGTKAAAGDRDAGVVRT